MMTLCLVDVYSVSASMLEMQQRCDKSSHELQTTLRYVQELELQTHQLQIENKRLTDDLAAEKEKLRALHLEKLAYDRKISELNLRSSRADVCFLISTNIFPVTVFRLLLKT